MLVEHPIKALVSEARKRELHIPEGKRFPVFCGCHGHCAACERPVVMNRLGRYEHRS